MSNASPETAIRTLLQSATDVTALRDSRCFPAVAPQKVDFPFQVYNRISRTHDHHMTGHSGHASARVQLDTYSTNKLEVDDLAEKSRVFLEVQSGSVSVGGQSITINRIRMEEDDATGDMPADGSAVAVHRIRQEYIVEHSVTVT